MHQNRVEKVLVVDDAFKLKGMITVKDFQKAEQKPNACKDEFGRLRVGAAVGAGPGNEERIDALVKSRRRCVVNRLFSRSLRRRITTCS